MNPLRTLGIGGAALALLLFAATSFHARVANASLADDIICATFGDLNAFGAPLPTLSHDDCPASLPEASSTLIVYKEVDTTAGGSATSSDFTITVAGAAGSESEPGAAAGVAFVGLAPGDYALSESGGPADYAGAITGDCAADGSITLSAGEEASCTITNTYTPPPPAEATLVATKIICPEESELPNLQGASHPTTAATASDFLAAHPDCHAAADWQFEWGDENAPDGGDATLGHVAGYTAFGPTDAAGTATTTIALGSMTALHLREVLQEGYIPFTYDAASSTPNGDDVSAELSCGDDGLNYDNWEWITSPAAGQTYYCVAYNAPAAPACDDDAATTIASDASTQVDGHNATVIDASMVNGGILPPGGVWADIPGASWIWADDGTGDDTTAPQTEAFTKSFTIAGAPLSGAIDLASDNGFVLIVNGTTVDTKQDDPADEQNYLSVAHYDLSPYLHAGANTLEIDVTNFGRAGTTFKNNPGGLIYQLSYEDNECAAPPPPPPTVTVTIDKFLDGAMATAASAGGASFPMASTWTAANLNGGAQTSGTYNLDTLHPYSPNAYEAITSPMDLGADYATEEVLGDTVGASCDDGAPYALAGYSVGGSFAAAEAAAASPTPPAFTNLAQNEYVIVHNVSCSSGGGGGDTYATTTIRAADLAQNLSDVIADPTQWLFYNDTNDTIDAALGSFVGGPASAPLGAGSAEIELGATTSPRTDLATYGFAGTLLADITRLSFSAYSHGGVAGPTESPYLLFDIDFATSTLSGYEGRLVYVPAANGGVPQDQWNAFDALAGGGGMWTWSHYAANGNHWPDGDTSEYRSWADIVSAFPGASILAGTGLTGIRVGEPGPVGYTGDIDAFIFGVTDGTNTTTTTFDFEPTDEGNPGGGGGGGGGGSGGPAAPVPPLAPLAPLPPLAPQVLGASTSTPSAACGPLLTSYLRMGKNNDAGEVAKLQQFLNDELGRALPVTGFFGALTEKAVEAFQLKYWQDVLAPWVSHGLASDHTPTGYVYKTTEYEINTLYCASLDLPFPSLP
jgi:hypothetical protein